MLWRGQIAAGLRQPGTWAALLSGVWLSTAFAPLNWAGAAWVALFPLLLAVLNQSPRTGFRLGYLAGAVYWLMAIFWLRHTTWAGWLLLSLYCALYTGWFGLLVSLAAQQLNLERPSERVTFILAVPLIWAGLEFLRGILFTGFAWNPLGNSQYEHLWLIQLAAWTGVYGISAVVLLVNVAIALTLHRGMQSNWKKPPRFRVQPEWPIAAAILFGVMILGHRTLSITVLSTRPLRAAVIQPNVPQYEKWTETFVDQIYERLDRLTRLAIATGAPDLVIWPETAVPDYVRESRRSFALVQTLTRLGTPLLMGSMDIVWPEEGEPQHFNSAMLFDDRGRLLTSYDKQHLVMFGEYVPLQRLLPFLTAMTPIEGSFDAGQESIIFTLTQPEIPFAVLICFEDTVARLARRAVRAGARLLINQTNDAWFEESAAARQHLTHSLFRAVETRTPVIRSANTGVSGGIDAFGRLHDVLTDDTGNTFVEGFRIVQSNVPTHRPLTFYVRYGDWFGWLSTAVIATVWVGWKRTRFTSPR